MLTIENSRVSVFRDGCARIVKIFSHHFSLMRQLKYNFKKSAVLPAVFFYLFIILYKLSYFKEV